MSKRLQRTLIVTTIGLLFFLASSFIQIHRGPALLCDHNDGRGLHTEYQLRYGLPFAYLKRSVSDFECYVKDSHADATGTFISQHEINYPNLLVDLSVWLAFAYFIGWLYRYKHARQGKDE